MVLSNCSGSSWRSGAQAPYRSRLGWNAGAFRHVLSSHTGSSLLYLVWELRSHPFYLIKSLCNCTSAAPMSSVPSVKRSTGISGAEFRGRARNLNDISRTILLKVTVDTRYNFCLAKLRSRGRCVALGTVYLVSTPSSNETD